MLTATAAERRFVRQYLLCEEGDPMQRDAKWSSFCWPSLGGA